MKVLETLCPDEEVFVRLQQGELPDAERTALMEHIDACPSCAELLVMLTDLEQPAPFHSEELLPSKKKRMIGRYEVIEQAGVGGLGVVYKTRDTRLDRLVAVKLLRPDVLATRPEQANEAPQRLQREARALARLDHPHIVAIYDMDRHEDQFFTACAFIDGGNLRDWLGRSPRHWRAVVALCLQVGRALGAAHEVGIVHRDIKPENVLLRGGEEHALLTDFGMATLPLRTSTTRFDTDDIATQQGMILGTPAYMSPEQLDGQTATAASDQFSFCVMLYEALYGFRPYHATDYQELLQILKRGELVKPSSATIPDAVFEVLAGGLRPMPGERHAGMTELVSALESILDHTREDASEATTHTSWRPMALVAIALLIGLIALVMKASLSEEEEEPEPVVEVSKAGEHIALAVPEEEPPRDARLEERAPSSTQEEVVVTSPSSIASDTSPRQDILPSPPSQRPPVEVASVTTPRPTTPPVKPVNKTSGAVKTPPVSPTPTAKRTAHTTPPAASPQAPGAPTPDLAQLIRDTYEDRREFSLAVLRYDGEACKRHYDNVVAVLPDWEFAKADNLFRLRCEYLRGDCKLASEFERLLPDQLVPMDARQIARHNLVYAHPSCLKSTTDRLQAAAHHALDACTNPMLKKSCTRRMQAAKKLIEAYPDDPAIKDRKISDSISWVILELEQEKSAKEMTNEKSSSPGQAKE